MPKDTLQSCVLEAFAAAGSNRLLIAYSGGIDSTVLLHLAARNFPEGKIVAVHVNHGLHFAALEWERFCRRNAARLDVTFRSLRVRVNDSREYSPEEAARNARYAALKTLLQEDDVLLTAHHGDDQAETVLLQLLRGSGPEGLAAMPKRMRFGAGSLLRPFLNIPRREIELYARRFSLEHVDDPSNDGLSYDRNYLRRQVAPLLNARWPAWQTTLTRAARHQAEACDLIRQLVKQHYRHCRNVDGTLSVERCRGLNAAEKKAVLRHWIKQAKLPTPSEKQLMQLVAVLLTGSARSSALLAWRGAEVRCYRDRLYAMEPRAPSTGLLCGSVALHWPGGTDLALPELDARLTWGQLCERAPELADAEFLTVRLRRGGERRAFMRMHKKLKKVFQESGVPPWERDRIPLIYADSELRLVWHPLK